MLSASACAAACIATPGCNAATWMGANVGWTRYLLGRNCFLKHLSTPCALPADVEVVPNAWMLVAQLDDCAYPSAHPCVACCVAR